MCGIAGMVTAGRLDSHLLQRMGDVIVRRGPDDQGIWTDEEAGVGFAHRRLSIVDLSPHGHQPMQSADGRYVLNYNARYAAHLAGTRRFQAGPKAKRGAGASGGLCRLGRLA